MFRDLENMCKSTVHVDRKNDINDEQKSKASICCIDDVFLYFQREMLLRKEHLTWHKGRDHYIKPILGESNNATVLGKLDGFPNTLPETNKSPLKTDGWNF